MLPVSHACLHSVGDPVLFSNQDAITDGVGVADSQPLGQCAQIIMSSSGFFVCSLHNKYLLIKVPLQPLPIPKVRKIFRPQERPKNLPGARSVLTLFKVPLQPLPIPGQCLRCFFVTALLYGIPVYQSRGF